ncbi:hypothetical protein CA13_68310 [Planctomycetes bacterium CA13]|uniref:Uncharacterized protein n=1 Tax=Novipirellula herctigrandis TaxID=2527986 RepID=A0A5C5YND2_9BACT|nr:hypothetical protein CA13_68310 [Planctomycetes bacterium CA13]
MIRTLTISTFAFVLLCTPSALRAEQTNTEEGAKPTLVINLTSGPDDLHAVSMGLHFAEHGLADGREAVVFFNVKSPPLARKNLPDSVRFMDKEPVNKLITDLLEHGAKMFVCPMCAEITGVQKDELVPGIQLIEDRKQLFDHLHNNTVVFSY